MASDARRSGAIFLAPFLAAILALAPLATFAQPAPEGDADPEFPAFDAEDTTPSFSFDASLPDDSADAMAGDPADDPELEPVEPAPFDDSTDPMLEPPVRPEELDDLVEVPVRDSGATIVGEVVFEGLRTRTPADLALRLRTRAGEPYNALVLREDVQGLARVMRRVNVRTEPTASQSIRVIFQVTEFSRLRSLNIVGARAVSPERIEKIANLKPGDVLDERVLRSLREALREEYDRKGLNRARIDVNEVPVVAAADPAAAEDSGQADLQILVQEGAKVLVQDVRIEGNRSFSNLRMWMLTGTRGSFLFLRNHYDDAAFEEDLVAIREFYHRHGYFDATVERGPFEETGPEGARRITPVIRIHEGGRYRVGAIEIRGARLFSREELLEPFEGMTGRVFDGEDFARAVGEVRDLYHDAGFLTTEVRPRHDLDPGTTTARLTIDVVERDRIYVGRVRVERPIYKDPEQNAFRRFYDRVAPPVSDEAIKREILLRPGEVYSRRNERRTERRLSRLGIFEGTEAAPAIRIVNEPTANPRVHDALIKLEEGATGRFGVGVGFGDVSGGFGYFWIEENNLFGDARAARVQLQLGTGASSATATYLDRHFNAAGDALSLSAYYNLYRRTGFRETVVGARSELIRELRGDWTRGLRARLEAVTLDERDGYDAKEDLNLTYPVLTGRVAFSQDTRWPLERPREGRLVSAALESGWADGFLVKASGEGEWYRRLGRDWVYRLNPKFELIPYESSSVGISERAFLGGNEDLRGFKFRGAGRRDQDEEEIGIGGAVKLLARNELIFPIFDPVYGVYFVDAGILGANPFSYEIPRLSTGLGARLQLDRVVIALDFAIPLVTGDGDQTQFVHFTFRGNL